jgi:hypothetical protein
MLKVRAGELAPLFKTKISSNPNFSFGTLAGRYIVLTFVAGCQHPSEQHLLTGLQSLPDYRFDDTESVLFIVSGDPEDAQLDRFPIGSRGVYGCYDANGTIADLFGVPYRIGRPISYLLSPRMQVFGIVLAGGPQQQINTIRDALRQQVPVEGFGEAFGSAPVLIIPHVFEPSLCRELIDWYKRTGAEQNVPTDEEDGRTIGKFDSEREVRRAKFLRDPLLAATIRDCFNQRVFPQIRRAYQFESRHLERYLVACYDTGEGAPAALERDTTISGAVHGRFAAILDLNSEEYDGGEVSFPEFGTRKFRSPSGSALIFSCSLLHQALPVRRGTRYAFLPLIYDEDDEDGGRIQELDRAAEPSNQTNSPMRETPDSSQIDR